MQSVQTVVVVGAGVAGLQTARALLKRGFDVLVLEQSDDVGGLWAKRYHGSSFGVQGKLSISGMSQSPLSSCPHDTCYVVNG
jgi:cation diffusion facilitator CzcD-associated flavoprotein CzcO